MTRYETVREVVTHPDVKKNPVHWRAWREGRIRPDWQLISWVAAENMLARDDDDHTRLRKLVSKAFTPRRVEGMRARIEELVEELLDRMAAGGPVADVKADYAYPLPMTVISDLFGVDDDGSRDELHRRIGMMFDQTITPEQALENHEGTQRFLTGLIERKRSSPADDMTSALIAARDEDNDRLSESELVWTLILIIGAGFETTMNVLTNAVQALLTHRDQLDLVVRGERSWSDAVEETLRWNTSIQNVPLRFAAKDLVVEGTTIPAGDALLVSYGSAGRDPRVHGDTADRFDLTREDKSHVSFSHGPHYCLGANLARMELNTALPALFARFPDMELLDTDPEQVPSIVSNGVVTLRVRLGEERKG
ncbi:cytochrome P450 family protein [Nocardiopsis chromatogenes]|uniref:cytochrome P450 family protein n=1 Tax=Nocardiopsis chromatogenes TaxID=280239 RepID=UPI000347251D|nr:cytochrome P450 [Nocardiopsis chromatogenes]